jgi:hypothetical protein
MGGADFYRTYSASAARSHVRRCPHIKFGFVTGCVSSHRFVSLSPICILAGRLKVRHPFSLLMWVWSIPRCTSQYPHLRADSPLFLPLHFTRSRARVFAQQGLPVFRCDTIRHAETSDLPYYRWIPLSCTPTGGTLQVSGVSFT